jgi:hypothetical protein
MRKIQPLLHHLCHTSLKFIFHFRLNQNRLLTRTEVGRTLGMNGEYSIQWKFSLKKSSKKTIVLIQKIDFDIDTCKCTVNPKTGIPVGEPNKLNHSKGNYYEVIGFISRSSKTIDFEEDRGTKKTIEELSKNHELPQAKTKALNYDDVWSHKGMGNKPFTGKVELKGEIRAFELEKNNDPLLEMIKQWKTFNPQTQIGTMAPVGIGILVGMQADNVKLGLGFTRIWDNSPYEKETTPQIVKLIWTCQNQQVREDV